MYYLTRLVEFEASHRYWNPAFSDEENRRTFGKCVSPYGHGHNYVLRVTLGGQVEPVGMQRRQRDHAGEDRDDGRDLHAEQQTRPAHATPRQVRVPSARAARNRKSVVNATR